MPSRKFAVCNVLCFNESKVSALKAHLPSREQLEVIAGQHKAMGHWLRQAILHVLGLEKCCVCDLAHVLSQPISTVSQHLRILKSAGLLQCRQEGKLVFYSLSKPKVVPRRGGGKVRGETKTRR